ncbi:MAG: hypothetical protein O3B35_04735, partial [Proteobacteria bacterium]|nr:hypothetical protein [Pseudomonadota bacterium]
GQGSSIPEHVVASYIISDPVTASLEDYARAMGYMFGGSVNYRGSREAAPGMMYGGRVKKMAFGNIVPGRGMTDKVPAMLTPGEFVVRKSVAQQMLPTLKAMNSQVFPGMNSYKFKTPSAGPDGTAALVMGQTTLQASNSTMLGPNNVQYNYNLTVSAETNANPEEIANAVIYQIKRFDDRRVKGTQIG